MRLKEEKGFAGTDIVIAIIIIITFMATLASLIVNINLNLKETERKTIATSYAIQEIEKIKIEGISQYTGKGIEEEYVVEEDIMNQDSFSGYHKKIIIKDYVLIKQDNSKKQDVVKEVKVEISYKLGNNEKNVTLSTYIHF